MKPKFLRDCDAAAELIGEEICSHLVWKAKDRKHIYEDDGTLHVEKNGIHVCFNIGQDRPFKEQNERMIIVLKKLGLFDHADVKQHCLHSDSDIALEEDESCPCCGGSGRRD